MKLLTKLAGLGALCLAGTGCLVGDILGTSPEDELRENMRTWVEADIDSYTYRLERQCFCFPFGRADITVADGQVVAAVNPADGSELAPEGLETIDDLFSRIADALAQDAHRLDVTYDAQYGFPVRVDIDYIEDAIDDEITLLASSFMANP